MESIYKHESGSRTTDRWPVVAPGAGFAKQLFCAMKHTDSFLTGLPVDLEAIFSMQIPRLNFIHSKSEYVIMELRKLHVKIQFPGNSHTVTILEILFLKLPMRMDRQTDPGSSLPPFVSFPFLSPSSFFSHLPLLLLLH